MEGVLDTCQRDFAADEVLVCMDETSRQQTLETRKPRRARPGKPAIVDYEYQRNGTANLFMAFAPLEGWRDVKAADRRTAVDWAHFIRDLADSRFSDKRIVLAVDNLNTHRAGSLYEAFEPEEASRLRKRFEFRYTPKHGSWLNMAEIEIGAMSRQCLSRRIPDRETMCSETKAWAERRNGQAAKVDWRFRTEDARIKLKSLYPTIQ